MRGHPLSWTTVAAILTLLAMSTGCASSPPSRFYALSTIPSTPAGDVIAEETVVAVAAVSIPLYLDRPQIVTRTSENELKLSEYERWAGSLREDLTTVMAGNLAELLRGQGVTVIGASGLGPRPGAKRYRIGIEVMRFEAAAEGPVTLRAQWVILVEGGDKPAFIGESNIQETVPSGDYGAVVAAMSRALATISREIATALTTKALAR